MNNPNRMSQFSNAIIQNLICPPPPQRIERLSKQELRELIIPKPDSICSNENIKSSVDNTMKDNDPSTSTLERLLKNVDELSRYCRPTTTVLNTDTEQINSINQTPRIKALSNAQRMRKVIFELMETERSYVQVNISNEDYLQ